MSEHILEQYVSGTHSNPTCQCVCSCGHITREPTPGQTRAAHQVHVYRATYADRLDEQIHRQQAEDYRVRIRQMRDRREQERLRGPRGGGRPERGDQSSTASERPGQDDSTPPPMLP